MRDSIDQPMTSRLMNKSITTARYSQPWLVAMWVISPVQALFDASGAKSRASRFSATGIECLESVVAL